MPGATISLLLAIATVLLAGCGDTARVPPRTDDAAVAIGWVRRDGDEPVPQVLRRAAGEWSEAALPDPILRAYEVRRPGGSTVRARFGLWRAGFTSATRAWILARGPGDQGGALLLSDDGGATWRDASDALPAEVRFGPSASTPLAMWFQSETDWWIAGGRRLGPVTLGPVVWRSGDGGGSWERALDRTGSISVTLLFSQLGTRPALVFDRDSPDACAWRIVLDGDGQVEPLLPPCPGGPEDLAEIGDHGWLTVGTAAVYSWTGTLALREAPLTLESPRIGGATRLDFADESTGVACGATAPAPIVGVSSTPACWYSADGGASWTTSRLPSAPGWMSVADVTLATPEHGWAIVGFGDHADLGPLSGFRFLRTDDGGASWQTVDTAFDDGSRMTGLAVWRTGAR